MENRLLKFILISLGLFLTITLLISVIDPSSEIARLLFSKENSSSLGNLVLGLLCAILTIFTFLNFRTLQKNPTTVTISLLGFPRAGKTVYLTVLFDQLQRQSNQYIVFNPYGSETIERVFSDLNILARQEWLRKTKRNEVFFYRAFATLKGLSPFKLFEKKYKLEIADFAGESFDELDPTTERWLHKSQFFQYVIQSDAILFAIDVSEIINPNNLEIESLQNSFIAALQILIEKKGVQENKRLKAPVTVLFLKSDMLSPRHGEIEKEEVLYKMARLFDVCKRRCLYFNYYFVSSVGRFEDIDLPPRKLEPINVTEPIIWILRRLRGEH